MASTEVGRTRPTPSPSGARQGDQTRPTRRRRRPAGILVLVLSAPALALMIIFLVVPSIHSVQYSFYDWNGIGTGTNVGFQNYRQLFSDDLFRMVISNTLVLAVFGTIGCVLVGLLWAYGIERRLPGWRTYRFLLFVPVVMPITVSALMWSLLLDTNGPVNGLLRDVGWSNPPDWLGSHRVALWVVVVVAVWQASGFIMLILLGAMEDVPADLHDAASLDGANSARRLVSIVVPYIRGTLATVTILEFVALLKAFDLIFAMTRGGPGNSTDVFGTYLYQEAFAQSEYGYGSAIAVVVTLVLFLITFFCYRWLLGKES